VVACGRTRPPIALRSSRHAASRPGAGEVTNRWRTRTSPLVQRLGPCAAAAAWPLGTIRRRSRHIARLPCGWQDRSTVTTRRQTRPRAALFAASLAWLGIAQIAMGADRIRTGGCHHAREDPDRAKTLVSSPAGLAFSPYGAMAAASASSQASTSDANAAPNTVASGRGRPPAASAGRRVSAAARPSTARTA